MHHIIYLSRATAAFGEAQLRTLLLQSRLRNASQDLTGLLLYGNEQFFQVLEGPEASVRSTYERIQRDPRHRDIITFADKAIAERAFADWSMAFQALPPQLAIEFADYHLSLTGRQPLDWHAADAQLWHLLRSYVH